MTIDTRRPVETPEGVDLGLRLAGLSPRALAFILDFTIRAAVYFVVAIGASFLGAAGMGIIYLAMFVVEWFYPVVFELMFKGQTPGKMVMKIAVMKDNGTQVDLASSVIRNLLRAADFLPIAYGLGLLAMLFNRDFKRLGDLAAGTVVVYRQQPAPVRSVPRAEPKMTPITLSRDEQQAVIEFGGRAGGLTPERAIELANQARPLVKEGQGDPRIQLLGYANQFLGRNKGP